MPIRYMSSSLLSYGFKLLLITSLLTSCEQAEFIDNPVLGTGNTGSLSNHWLLNENENVITSVVEQGLYLDAQESGRISYSQTFSLDSGEYFLLTEYDANIENGSFFINLVNSKSLIVQSKEKICERTIFSISVGRESDITIEFGLESESKGNVLIESIFLAPIEYNYLDSALARTITNDIGDKLNITLKKDSTLSQSIDALATSINTAFLSKDEEEKLAIIATYQDPIFSKIGTGYLSKYINDLKIRDSYCQKSSLSLDELIRAYNIPTRQIHWQKDCSGFHQFLEYWNTYSSRWEIIDPYYGIRYVDAQGNYLDFESIEKLVRSESFTKENIKKIDIGRLTFNEEEILDGWIEGGLAVHVKE